MNNLIPPEIKTISESFLANPEISNSVSLILSPEIQEKLIIFRVISFFVSLFLIIAIVYFLRNTSFFDDHVGDTFKNFTAKSFNFKKNTEKWEEIIKKLKLNSESGYKLAIIEADDFLYSILEKMGYKEENTIDQLKQCEFTKTMSFDSIKDAYRIRNDIVSDPDYRLDLKMAEEVLEIYEKILQELEIF